MVSDGEKDVSVGYWPKELFPYMGDGAKQASWGGIAQAGKDGISPPMGSGHFPDGDYSHACYFSHVHYVDHENVTASLGNNIPNTLFEQVDKPNCYGLKNEQLVNQQDLGYSFTFGGPGGIRG